MSAVDTDTTSTVSAESPPPVDSSAPVSDSSQPAADASDPTSSPGDSTTSDSAASGAASSDASTSDASAAGTSDATTTEASSPAAVGGWPDAPAGGWNGGSPNAVAGLRRIAVSNLTTVNADPAPNPNATESACGRAIAYLPTALDATSPIEVLLHFHGHNIGYRQRTAPATVSPTDLQTRSVRDIKVDQIADQINQSGRAIIAILPQGTLGSSFSPPSGVFDCDTFVNEVLATLVNIGALAQQPTVAKTILSGHSGGGGFITSLEQSSGQPHFPATLEALFLFDAINGFTGQPSGEARVHVPFLTAKLDADLVAIAGAPDDAGKLAAAGASFRFSGAYSQSDYVGWYAPVVAALDGWFKSHAAQLGGSGSPVYTALRANYVTTAISGVPHDEMVGHGNLLAALKTLSSDDQVMGGPLLHSDLHFEKSRSDNHE